MLTFRSSKTMAIGEAMIEMAVIGDDTYRRSFAGDTFDVDILPRHENDPVAVFEITDIALPSFDDEAALWGDVSPEMTIERLKDAGVSEIVIKNGAGPVIATSDAKDISVDTPAVSGIRDTSGAGDAFNAGYLAARLIGTDQFDAIKDGQLMSSEVIQHFGARIPNTHIPKSARGQAASI